MRPTTDIGTDLDGVRDEVQECPWRRTVIHGEVELSCRWLWKTWSLRGAIVSALDDPHVDFHGHLENGQTRHAKATIYYRVRRDRPVVYAYGPRAIDHIRTVAMINSLVAPTTEVVQMESASVQMGRIAVGIHKERWYRYELVTPYFPSSVAYARRPRGGCSPERWAWAGQALTSSIRMWLGSIGLITKRHRPVHVHLGTYDDVRVTWRDQNKTVQWGFLAKFVSNAILPPGIGIGQHVAEGFGEVRNA